MSAVPLTAAALGAAVAAVAAAADGALLAVERQASSEDGDSRNVSEARERRRRALAFARLLAHLTLGVGIGLTFRPDGITGTELAIAAIGGLLIVLLVETGARAWGDASGGSVLDRLDPLVELLERLLSPVTAVAMALDRTLERALPEPTADEVDREATEQFRQVVTAEADVTHDEAALLHGVFSLGDTEVHEVMVPRVDMVGLEVGTPWSEVVDRIRSFEHSRFPVYEETLDEIVGVLYAKDLLPAILGDEEPPGGWETLARLASFIPRTKPIGDQLRDFRASQTHIALVADEFGGIAGLVTIEDVLEEIVGEIRDEYDEEEEPEVVVEEGRRFWVNGRVTLEALSELLGTPLERAAISTVGGLVYDELGRIPRSGEAFVLGGYRVIVERVVRRKVERVYFERLESPARAAEHHP